MQTVHMPKLSKLRAALADTGADAGTIAAAVSRGDAAAAELPSSCRAVPMELLRAAADLPEAQAAALELLGVLAATPELAKETARASVRLSVQGRTSCSRAARACAGALTGAEGRAAVVCRAVVRTRRRHASGSCGGGTSGSGRRSRLRRCRRRRGSATRPRLCYPTRTRFRGARRGRSRGRLGGPPSRARQRRWGATASSAAAGGKGAGSTCRCGGRRVAGMHGAWRGTPGVRVLDGGSACRGLPEAVGEL